MSARALLSAVRVLVLDGIGEDAYDRLCNPPTRAERAAERREELRALGIPFEAMG